MIIKKRFVLSLVFLASLNLATASAQIVNIYAGGSFNFLGFAGPGWGLELGIRTDRLYATAEYGAYSYSSPPTSNPALSLTVGGNSPPFQSYSTSREQYYGFDAGYIISNSIFVGAVLLWSDQSWMTSDGEIKKRWFNIGPDIRFIASPKNHVIIDAAYTLRRGIKLGACYVF